MPLTAVSVLHVFFKKLFKYSSIIVQNPCVQIPKLTLSSDYKSTEFPRAGKVSLRHDVEHVGLVSRKVDAQWWY